MKTRRVAGWVAGGCWDDYSYGSFPHSLRTSGLAQDHPAIGVAPFEETSNQIQHFVFLCSSETNHGLAKQSVRFLRPEVRKYEIFIDIPFVMTLTTMISRDLTDVISSNFLEKWIDIFNWKVLTGKPPIFHGLFTGFIIGKSHGFPPRISWMFMGKPPL